MVHKRLLAMVLGLFLLAVVGNYAKSQIKQTDSIPDEWIQMYNQGTEEEKLGIKNQIVKQIIRDIDKKEWEDQLTNINLQLALGDFLGDEEKEIAFILSQNPKNGLVAIYKKEEDTYHFVTQLGDFFEIKNAQIIPLSEKGKDLLVIREYVDQMLGAFEASTYIKAYSWEDEKMQEVLNIIEEYHAYWNELWDGKKPREESRWLRIAQKSDLQWENGMYPVIRMLNRQTFSISNETNMVEIPAEKDFEVKKVRDISEIYYWNPSWQHFILGEGTDTKTGERVAIIDDLSANPFVLAGYENESYRIKRLDGTIEEVPKDSIKSVTPIKDIYVS